MKQYFKLVEECYVISGEEAYALYNVMTGNVFQLNCEEGYFCTLVEDNMQIDKACKESNLSLEAAEKLISNLESVGLGMQSDYPVTMDKLNVLPKWSEKTYFKYSIAVNKATIDVSFECSNNCNFCNDASVTNKLRCISCNGKNSPIHLETAYKIIDILSARECKELYLKNGDLLSDPDKLMKIVDYAKERGIENISLNIVKPITNSMFLKYVENKNISLILQRTIDANTPIDTIINEARHYLGTNALFLLLTYIENSDKVKQVALTLAQQFNLRAAIDFLVSKNMDAISDKYFEIESHIGTVNLISFSIRQLHNECFYRNCYFDSQGNIFPCAGLTKEKLGDIYSLPETFKSQNLSRFWDMALDKKEPCRNCSLRYACNNCESLNFDLYGNFAKNVLCSKRLS